MFSKRLKELRKEKNMSQKQLAEKLNCDQSMIARWENGANEPTARYLIKMATIFGTSIDYLVGLTDYRFIVKL